MNHQALSTANEPDTEESPRTPAELLYREHYDFVWRNARRLGCADDWVDDAVHEAFLVASRRIEDFEGRSSVKTWLFSILFRVIQRMQRDRARYRARLARYSETRLGEQVESPEESSAAAGYLRQLLSRLDDPKRIVVILIELEGMTAMEVAKELGVARGTVETRLRSARRQLSKMLERDRAVLKGRNHG